MNNIDISKLFLKIIRIKGKVSYNNAELIIKKLLLQYANNTNINVYYDILYPLSISGLIEFSNNYWYISPSIIIKYNNKYKFINNYYLYRNPIQDIKEDIILDNISIIPIKKYEILLYKFPNINDVAKYSEPIIRCPEIMYNDKNDERIENISLLNDYDIIRNRKEKYGERYVKYNNKLYKLYERNKNPDSILYARLNQTKHNVFNQVDEVKIYKANMPIILGRLLFILSDSSFKDVFNNDYKFRLNKKYINQLKKILGL